MGPIDALLLTVLPCLIVYRSLGGRLSTWRRRIAYFGASLALVMTITAVYHPGASAVPRRWDPPRDRQHDHLDADAAQHEPVGSIADHAAMHISAVAHDYGTEVRLPPPTKADWREPGGTSTPGPDARARRSCCIRGGDGPTRR